MKAATSARYSARTVDYVNAAAALWRHVAALQTSRLPVLVQPPQRYSECIDAYIAAKITAQGWIDEIFPAFAQLALTLVGANAYLREQLDSAAQALALLQTDPTEATRQRAREAIGRVLVQMVAATAALQHIHARIGWYAQRIAPEGERLASNVAYIRQAIDANADAVARMKAVNAELQGIIEQRNTLSRLNTGSNVVLNLFLAAAGAVIGIPFSSVAAGAIIAGGLGMVTGIITAFAPIHPEIEYQVTLKDVQLQMDAVSGEIGLENTIAASLEMLSDKVTSLSSGSGEAARDADLVSGYWLAVRDDLAQVDAGLRSSVSALDRGDATAAQTALDEAASRWSDVVSVLSEIQTLTFQLRDGVHTTA